MQVVRVALILRFMLVGLCVFAITSATCTPKPVPLSSPAAFRVDELIINPDRVDPGEEVTITVRVTNIGGTIGSYTAQLKINGVTEAERTVDLAPGTSQRLRFSVTRDTPGTYTVTLGELTGDFVVIKPFVPPPPPPATAAPAPSPLVTPSPVPPKPYIRRWILTNAEATQLLRRAIDTKWISRCSVHFLPRNKVEFRRNSERLTTTAGVSEGKLYLFGVRSEDWFWLRWHIGDYTSYAKLRLVLIELPPWFDPSEEIAPDVTYLPTFDSITTEDGKTTICYVWP